jgi:hypothetical protein
MNAWLRLPWAFEARATEAEVPLFVNGEVEELEVKEVRNGEVVVTLEGIRELDGVVVAVLDLTGRIEAKRTAGGSSVSRRSEDRREIAGEALWNLKAGHLHSLELEVERSRTTATETTGDDSESDSSETSAQATTVFKVTFEEV